MSAPEGRRLALLAAVFGFGGSLLASALAVFVAGRGADRAYLPIELALRVTLLLAGPVVGGLVGALALSALPRWRGSGGQDGSGPAGIPAWAVGAGIPLGPAIVLRLDRIVAFGVGATVAVLALLALWGAGGALATAWSAGSRRMGPAAQEGAAERPATPDLAPPVARAANLADPPAPR